MHLVYHLAFLTFVFCLGSVYFKTPEKRAYIISTIYAPILSYIGIWKLYRVIMDSNGIITKQVMYSDDYVSVEACKLLFSGNILELVIGSFFFPKQLDFLSNWVHHIVYCVVLAHLLYNGHTNGFSFAVIEEIPTFVKSLGSISPNLRSDYLFGMTFFAFRIVFHVYYNYQFYMNDYESIYWKFIFVVFLLHSYWIYCWILGMKRRSLKNTSH